MEVPKTFTVPYMYSIQLHVHILFIHNMLCCFQTVSVRSDTLLIMSFLSAVT